MRKPYKGGFYDTWWFITLLAITWLSGWFWREVIPFLKWAITEVGRWFV